MLIKPGPQLLFNTYAVVTQATAEGVLGHSLVAACLLTCWQGVKATSPVLKLLLAVLLSRLSFVLVLQVAVVSLVQSPVLLNGYPQLVELFENKLQSLDTALQH